MWRFLLTIALLLSPMVTSAHTSMVDVDAIGKVDKQGRTTITGTIDCSEGLFGHIQVVVRQPFAKRVIITNSGSADILCTGEPQPFETLVPKQNGSFKPGNATLSYRVMLNCDEYGCAQYEEDNADVRLRP